MQSKSLISHNQLVFTSSNRDIYHYWLLMLHVSDRQTFWQHCGMSQVEFWKLIDTLWSLFDSTSWSGKLLYSGVSTVILMVGSNEIASICNMILAVARLEAPSWAASVNQHGKGATQIPLIRPCYFGTYNSGTCSQVLAEAGFLVADLNVFSPGKDRISPDNNGPICKS